MFEESAVPYWLIGGGLFAAALLVGNLVRLRRGRSRAARRWVSPVSPDYLEEGLVLLGIPGATLIALGVSGLGGIFLAQDRGWELPWIALAADAALFLIGALILAPLRRPRPWDEGHYPRWAKPLLRERRARARGL